MRSCLKVIEQWSVATEPHFKYDIKNKLVSYVRQTEEHIRNNK